MRLLVAIFMTVNAFALDGPLTVPVQGLTYVYVPPKRITLIRTNPPSVVLVDVLPPLPPHDSPPALPKGTNLSYSSTQIMTNFYRQPSRK